MKCRLSLPLALLLTCFASPSAAKVWYATPSGGPGYDEAGNIVAHQTEGFDGEVEIEVASGDEIRLLADGPALDPSTQYRLHLTVTQAATLDASPVVISGLGQRTVLVGKSLFDLGECSPSSLTEKSDCEAAGSVVAFAGKEDLLEAALDAAPRQ